MANDPVITNIPGSVPPDQSSFFSSVKRAIELLMGQSRNTGQTRAVRVHELSTITNQIQTVQAEIDALPSPSQDAPSPSQDAPDPPTSLVVTPTAPFSHTLTWTNPTDENASHIEIWAAENSQVRDNALFIGITTITADTQGAQGQFKNGAITVTSDYTYWIRSVSFAGLNSAWCPPDIQGGYVVQGSASLQEAIDEVLAILTGQITESELFEDLSDRIDLVDGPIDLIGSVAARIDAERIGREDADGLLAADISDNSADIVTEQTARISADDAIALDITIMQTDIGDNEAAILAEQTARSNADSAMASDISLLQTDVSNNAAAILSEQTARSNADSAIASDVTALQTDVSGNAAAILSEQTARSDADSAMASDISALQTDVSGNTASIITEQTTRSAADSAMASDISLLQTDVGNNSAAILTEQTTRADADTALGSQIDTVEATIDDPTTGLVAAHAAVQTEQTARVSADGEISAKYSVKVDTNGYVAGFGLISEANEAGVETSEFVILVDKFKIITPGATQQTPFVAGMVGGVSTIGMTGNVLIDGSVKAVKVDVDDLFAQTITIGTGGSITAGDVIIDDDGLLVGGVGGITVDSGGQIKVEDGGDIDLYNNTNTNPAKILFHEDSTATSQTFSIYTDYYTFDSGDFSRLVALPSAVADSLLVLGQFDVCILHGQSKTRVGVETTHLATTYNNIMDILDSSILIQCENGPISIESTDSSLESRMELDTGIVSAFSEKTSGNIFSIAQGSSYATKSDVLTVDYAGNVVADGGVSANSITSTGGITAASITFDTDALNDYEEGEYAPTLTCGSGSVTLDSANETLAYTKIGNQVTITGKLQLSSISSPSGTLTMSLPYAIESATDTAEQFVGFVLHAFTNLDQLMIFGASGSAVTFYNKINDGSLSASVADEFSAGSGFAFQFSYFTSA